MPNTIVLKGDFVRKEGVAGGAITPGHLISGFDTGLVVHADAAGEARKAFALENDLVGEGITDAYASGDTVQYGIFQPGAEVYAIAGSAVTKGDPLGSDGNGKLIPASGTPVVAWAMEAAAADNDRIKVEVA